MSPRSKRILASGLFGQSRPHRFAAPGLAGKIPGSCAGCGFWPARGLCQGCIDAFEHLLSYRRCVRCAAGLSERPSARLCGRCLTIPVAYDSTVAALPYIAPWDNLVTRLKFHGALDLAPIMARMLVEAIHQTAVPAPSPDCVVPIAMSATRLAERGYNQAWQIARQVGRQMRLPTLAHALVRTHEKASQIQRTRAERQRALRGAFNVAKSVAHEIAGRHVGLVDDVMTSGATLQAAASALKAAGAATVTVWVFARTPDNHG